MRSRLSGNATPRSFYALGFYQYLGTNYWYGLYYWTETGYGNVYIADFYYYTPSSNTVTRLYTYFAYFEETRAWVGPVGYGSPVITYLNAPFGVCPGHTAIITGSNFQGATDVSFNGVPAQSFTVDSYWQITAVPGPGTPGNGASNTLTVSTPHGSAAVSYPQPSCGGGGGGGGHPIIKSISAPKGVCPGQTVVITGMHFMGVTSVTFDGSAASSFTVDSDTQITAVVAPLTPAVGNDNVDVNDPNNGNSIYIYYQAPCNDPGGGGPPPT